MKTYNVKMITTIQIIILATIVCLHGDERSIFCVNLANALKFPVELLIEEDLTEKMRMKYDNNIIYAGKISDKNNCFVPISLAVSNAGWLLKETMINKIEVHIKNNPSQSNIIKFYIEDIAHGYSYSIAGPGGEESFIVLNIYEKSVDVQLKITIPEGGSIVKTEKSKDYFELYSNGEIEKSLKEFLLTTLLNKFQESNNIKDVLGLNK